MNRHQLAVAIVLMMLGTVGVAQPVNPLNSVTLPQNTINQIKKNPQSEMERFLGMLFTQNPNGVFDLQHMAIDNEIEAARRRSRVLGSALAYDFNGDMSIDAEEIASWMRAGPANRKAWLQSMLEFGDLDGNGDISLHELQVYAEKTVGKTTNRNPNSAAISGFDVNGDNLVTPQEIKDVFEHVLSGGEVVALSNSHTRPVGPVPDVSQCNWPQPSANAIILFLNVNQGTDLTNVTIAGQDTVTKIATLKIEPGVEPIYLISSTYRPIIWNVTGETGRVEHMILGAKQGLDGATGLPSNKITFSSAPDCVPNHYASGDKSRSAIAKEQLKALLGRRADWLISSAYLEHIDLPSTNNWKSRVAKSGTTLIQGSARYLLTEEGPILLDGAQTDADGITTFKVYRDLERFNPKGVTELVPTDVVSSAKVELYEVLPQQPGIIQLIRDGAIRVTDDDFLFIQKPISRFPSGLTGPQSLRFILGDGIALPKGNAGGSSVVSEKTGECLVKKCFRAGDVPSLNLK